MKIIVQGSHGEGKTTAALLIKELFESYGFDAEVYDSTPREEISADDIMELVDSIEEPIEIEVQTIPAWKEMIGELVDA